MKKRNFVLRGFNAFTSAERICGSACSPLQGDETAKSSETSLNPSPLTPLEKALRSRLSSLRCRCRDCGSRLPALQPSAFSPLPQGERGEDDSISSRTIGKESNSLSRTEDNKGFITAERIYSSACAGETSPYFPSPLSGETSPHFPSPLAGEGAGVRGNKKFALAVQTALSYKFAPARDRARSAKGGFTLAEVLITLVIIGVIGALTVPSLLQNTQKQEYVTALKKAYSTLSQVTQQIIAEEGSPASTTAASKDGWAYSNFAVYDMFKKYLNNAKECRGEKGCGINDANLGNMKDNNGAPKLILADGMLVNFAANNPLCSGWSVDGCQYIDVDVNGSKKPNKSGRDIFSFILTKNGIVPSGCSSSCTQPAYWCTCRVLTENAMNY